MSERYPLPSDARRHEVQQLGNLARALDDEAAARAEWRGYHNAEVRDELRRAAGTVRLVATLVVQGGMSDARARFWITAGRDYLRLVRRADRRGVIR